MSWHSNSMKVSSYLGGSVLLAGATLTATWSGSLMAGALCCTLSILFTWRGAVAV